MNAALSVSPLACWLIGLYQRHVSPYKGFSCAYRVVRRRQSCSQYAKRVVARFGVALGALLLRRRFRRCHDAAACPAVVESRAVLDYEPKREKQKQKGKESSRRSACDDVDACSGCGDIPAGGADLLSACPVDGLGCCDGF